MTATTVMVITFAVSGVYSKSTFSVPLAGRSLTLVSVYRTSPPWML